MGVVPAIRSTNLALPDFEDGDGVGEMDSVLLDIRPRFPMVLAISTRIDRPPRVLDLVERKLCETTATAIKNERAAKMAG
jgi:hypothetical protein